MSAFSALCDIGQDALELMWQTRCVVCNMPGELLCEECRTTLPWIEQRWACPHCGAPFGSIVCSECMGKHPSQEAWESRSVVCAMGFKGPPACMITNLKDAHELRLAPLMAAAILTALEEAQAWPAPDGLPRWDSDAIDGVCFIPATKRAYARRGFDHMQLVSEAFCRQAQLPLADVLTRPEAQDQRGLGVQDRTINLQGTVSTISDVSGARLLLLDDVITTGASVREATRVLHAQGAASVTVGALARVW